MAKRFTDTELWDKEWFMSLNCKLKCLVQVIRDKADLCGVWSPNWIIASAYIGEKVTEKELLEIDGGRQFKKIKNGKIFCIGFIDFQYGELSEKSPVHKKIISMLRQNGILETYKNIIQKHPIDRVSNTLQEEEEDKEEEKEEEEDFGKSENLLPEVEILEYLNEAAGKKFKPTEANLKFIRARFTEKYTVDDLKSVIDVKVHVWKGDTDWDKYLRPETLFNATKFQTYIQEAEQYKINPGKFKKQNERHATIRTNSQESKYGSNAESSGYASGF